MSDFYRKSIDEVIDRLETTKDGLQSSQIEERQAVHGLNELEQADQDSIWDILWHNINNIIVYLLGAAVLLSLFMQEWVEAGAVFLALLIAILTGFFVEWKAQGSVQSLQKMIVTTSKVIRDGKTIEIDSSQLVPGDLLILEEGDAIAADGRLLAATNLAVIESALTGESEPVDKDASAMFEDEEALGDRLNMVFSGTAVARGNGRALVTATGMKTQVGQISALIDQESKAESPLDKELHRLGKALIILAILAALLVIVIGLLNGKELVDVLHIAIVLAIAAIPEALPAVSTITLSRGMRMMSDQKALVKSLSAVETLGSTTVIASDKTGTLTENQMSVEQISLPEERSIFVTGRGYQPVGELTENDEKITVNPKSDIKQLDNVDQLSRFIANGLAASNASYGLVEDTEDEYKIVGDPTEGALVVLAAKTGLEREDFREAAWKRLAEIPFHSDHKYMAVLMSTPKGQRLIVKGAPDILIHDFIGQDNDSQYWLDKNDALAAQGMRVLALASLDLRADTISSDEFDQVFEEYKGRLTMDGLAGIIDPPRQDVKDSVEQTQAAGIAIKMITGDHPKTASVIAKEIGIKNHEQTLTGKEIDQLVDQDDFAERVKETGVFARVSPENKLQIVQSLQEEGELVAVTGDGVNDAPALNGSNIGVAMGVRGTEVAKETAQMILTDDQFSTIVDAVEIGRIIFANIKKYVQFLFSCNMVEIVTVLLTIVFLLPMPIQALHILYLNLVIDIAPAMALAFEVADPDIMNQPPRKADGGLVNKAFLTKILLNGSIIAVASFVIFHYALNKEVDLSYAQTATFTFMAFAQLLHIFNVRNPKGFGLNASFLKNKILMGALFLSVLLQLAAIYLPPLQIVLDTQALTSQTWMYILLALVTTTVVVYGVNRLLARWLPEEETL